MKFLFRLIPATHSDDTPKSGRLHAGISGRFASEWVAGFRRNARPESSGIRTDSRFQMVGYLIAGILALIGIVGIALGIRILKKRQILASVLVGFFFTWVVIAIIVFIFGP